MNEYLKYAIMTVFALLVLLSLEKFIIYSLGIATCLVVQVVGGHTIAKIRSRFFYEDDEEG